MLTATTMTMIANMMMVMVMVMVMMMMMMMMMKPLGPSRVPAIFLLVWGCACVLRGSGLHRAPPAAQCSALTARTLDRPMTSNNPREESPSPGVRPVWSWMARRCKQLWIGSTRCTAKNCKLVAFPPVAKQAAWQDCVDEPMYATGSDCRMKPCRDSQVRDSENGKPSSSRPLTSDDPEGDHRHQQTTADHGLQGPTSKPRAMCCPRCYRAVAFQRPAHLHPFSPYGYLGIGPTIRTIRTDPTGPSRAMLLPGQPMGQATVLQEPSPVLPAATSTRSLTTPIGIGSKLTDCPHPQYEEICSLTTRALPVPSPGPVSA